jgi:hypothetical protein
LDPGQLDALDRVLHLIRQHRIPVLMVQVPITSALYRSKTNNAYIDSLLAARGRYRNFNSMACFDDLHDFIDDNHLSQRGAEKFDSIFIHRMQRENLFPQVIPHND